MLRDRRRSTPRRWVTAATWCTTARSPSWSTRSATSTASWPWPATRGRADHPRVGDAHPQRLRHRRVRPGPAIGAAYHGQRRRQGRLRPACRCRRRRDRRRRRHAGAGGGHPGPHVHPPVVRPGGDGGGDQVAVFTGGSLLYGSTGRPDLLGAQHAHDLARHQHASAHRLAAELPADTPRCTRPTGSAASARPPRREALASTIGQEKRVNPALTQAEERVRHRAAGRAGRLPGLLRPHGPGQRRRPGPDRPAPAAAGRRRPNCAQRIDAGEWVVDLRHRTAFAAGHLPARSTSPCTTAS